jgi:hypothetical protein
MDRIVRDLHLGPRPVVSKAFMGLRRRGYIIFSDTSRTSHYWVNGNRLTTYQLVALALLRGVPLRKPP